MAKAEFLEFAEQSEVEMLLKGFVVGMKERMTIEVVGSRRKPRGLRSCTGGIIRGCGILPTWRLEFRVACWCWALSIAVMFRGRSIYARANVKRKLTVVAWVTSGGLSDHIFHRWLEQRNGDYAEVCIH
jgi:hypothetical protein